MYKVEVLDYGNEFVVQFTIDNQTFRLGLDLEVNWKRRREEVEGEAYWYKEQLEKALNKLIKS